MLFRSGSFVDTLLGANSILHHPDVRVKVERFYRRRWRAYVRTRQGRSTPVPLDPYVNRRTPEPMKLQATLPDGNTANLPTFVTPELAVTPNGVATTLSGRFPTEDEVNLFSLL